MHGVRAPRLTTTGAIILLSSKRKHTGYPAPSNCFHNIAMCCSLCGTGTFQEVSDKLVTTMKELPVHKPLGVLTNIKNKLAIETPPTTLRTLTCSTHEWLLPPGNLQRVPIVTRPEQRGEQRVTSTHPDKLPTLQCITEAPPIMAAPNPTTKCILKPT
jgi:hypothetical protein